MKVLITKIPVISIALSLVVAWLLIPIFHGFPMVPFFILFVCLGTLIYVVRINKTWFDTVVYLGILVLSCFLLLRANGVILLLNFVFITLLGSLLALPIAKNHTLLNLITTPISLVSGILSGRNSFPYSWSRLKKYNQTNYIKKYLPSILITLVFLVITIPLLSSANPFFNQLVQNVFKFFNLTQFRQFLLGDEPFFYVVRTIFFIALAFIIPRILTVSTATEERKKLQMSLPVDYLIPKIAMAILLIVFFITQAQLYFATPEILQSMGYTNSRLTNEVFFQVTIVAFIIFFLAYLDPERRTRNKIISLFLILEAFFLIGMAFKSVYEYSYLWGLTQKRLWGYATMTWLTGALLIFVWYYAKQIPLFRFFKTLITYTVLVMFMINISNFDYLISHYSKARTQSGTDYAYLSKLSTDSAYYKQTLNNLIVEIEKSGIREDEKIFASYILLGKIDGLKRAYSKGPFINSFNFSSYNEFLSIKDINTEAYRNKLTSIEQKFTQQEMLNSQQQTPVK